jgi:nitrite reductase (NADH) large subunit
MKKYVIVGNGVAGTTAAETIRKNDAQGSITIVTDEDLPFYWRIQLNEFIAGEKDEQGLLAKKERWYEDQKIDLKLQTRIIGGNAQERFVVTENKEEIPYDSLLIATGSHSFIPPIKGSDQTGVFALRSIRDARAISEWADKTKEVVLIGGGLLGLEAGNALRKRGKKVMVVEFFPRLLPRQLDNEGAQKLQAIMEEMGFSFRLGAKTEEIAGGNEIEGVQLEGGETIPAQMVVISAGVRPNLELAEALGLEADKGIKVDEYLRTKHPDVFAAGDVAEYRGMPYGIWPAAMEQGQVAGMNMVGKDSAYHGTTMANTLKVVGVELASAGEIDVDHKFESKVVVGEKIYKKLVLENDRIVGCIMLGSKKGFNQIADLMSAKRNVAEVKDQVLSEEFDFKTI